MADKAKCAQSDGTFPKALMIHSKFTGAYYCMAFGACEERIRQRDRRGKTKRIVPSRVAA